MRTFLYATLVFMSAFHAPALARQKWALGITAGAGASVMHGGYPVAGTRSHFRPSLQVGGFAEWHIGARSGIGAELLLMSVNSGETLTITYMDALGNSIGEGDMLLVQDHIYAALPVYYRISFGKLALKAALRADIPIVSSWRSEVNPVQPGPAVRTSGDTRYFDNFDFGIRAGAAACYALHPRLTIDVSYFYGLNNPFKVESPFQWNLHQVMAGVHYTVGNKAAKHTKAKN